MPSVCVSVFNLLASGFNPLKTELKPIYHLLALLGAHHIIHVSRIRVKWLQSTLRVRHSFR
jgi:hypothetical protein